MKYAFPDLARRGLGNMLFTWGQAVVYCHNTGAKMIAPVWARITRIGPWIRKERYKRFYGNQFTNKGYVNRFWGMIYRMFGLVKVFRDLEGYFLPLLNNQEVIKEELYKIINPKILAQVDEVKMSGDYIGVHVRRGDFSHVGIATADDWYIRAIREALSHESANGHRYIRVFSDGYPSEVEFIQKNFPNEKVVIMPKAPAIQDILLLSNSKVIVCSPLSTFSMWAVFLGQMPSVWRKGDELPQMYVGNQEVIYA